MGTAAVTAGQLKAVASNPMLDGTVTLELQELHGKGDRHFLKRGGGPVILVLRPEQARQTQFRSAGHLISLSPRNSC
jgi:hypothetical protein